MPQLRSVDSITERAEKETVCLLGALGGSSLGFTFDGDPSMFWEGIWGPLVFWGDMVVSTNSGTPI